MTTTLEEVLAPEEVVPEVKELTVADILYKAADLIAQPGKWIQGTAHRNGAHCAAGAMIVIADPTVYSKGVHYNVPKNNYAYRGALLILAELLNTGDQGAIVRYNDNPFVTQSDVVNLLRKAGDIAVQKGQ